MFSIQWFDSEFEGGRLRIINGMPSEAEAVDHADTLNISGYDVVPTSTIPTDRTFRNAWRVQGSRLYTDLQAAQLIVNEVLISKRGEEYKEVDTSGQPEAGREQVRAKYNILQSNIDTVSDVASLKELMRVEGWIS